MKNSLRPAVTGRRRLTAALGLVPALSLILAGCASGPDGVGGVTPVAASTGISSAGMSSSAATASGPKASAASATSGSKAAAAPATSGSKTTALGQAAGAKPAFFELKSPGAPLPSGAQCATWVRQRSIKENKGANQSANQRRGHKLSGASGSAARVDGRFTGSTEQILRWAACKWGVNEDVVKAQAAIESWWQMGTLGDFGTDGSRCPPGHGIGADGKAGQCAESWP